MVTVGSASKLFWGGLRVGWLRSDSVTIRRLAALRARQDLSSPILEQLACAQLLDQLAGGPARTGWPGCGGTATPWWRRCAATLPSAGGSPCRPAARCCGASCRRRPRARSRRRSRSAGLRITPGSRFAADGTLESWLRLPFTRPAEDLEAAVRELAQAWAAVAAGRPAPAAASEPVEAYVV